MFNFDSKMSIFDSLNIFFALYYISKYNFILSIKEVDFVSRRQ